MRPLYIPPPAPWWQRLIEAFRPAKPAPPPLRLIGPRPTISDETASRMIVSHILNATPWRRIEK